MNAFARRFACQPGFSFAAHSGSVSQSSLMSIDDGVRWKTYSSFAFAPRFGIGLHGGGAGADDADDLVGEVLEVGAGVLVVPPRGVERVAGKVSMPSIRASFGFDSVPLAHIDEAGPHGVAAVGRARATSARPRPTPSR